MKRCIRGSQDTSLDSKIKYDDMNSLLYDAFGIKIGGSTNPKKDFRSWTQDGATRCKFTIWFTTMNPDSASRGHWAFATPVAQNNGDALLQQYGMSGGYSEDDTLRSLVNRAEHSILLN